MIERNKLTDSYARITLTRGEGYASSDPRLCDDPTLVDGQVGPVTSMLMQQYEELLTT